MEHSFRRTTRVLPPTSTPVWKESFVLPVELPQVQQLHLILWDHDDLVPDDKIGRCVCVCVTTQLTTHTPAHP